MCLNIVSKVFKYAETSTLLAISEKHSVTIRALKQDVNELTEWIHKWRLKATVSKAKKSQFLKRNQIVCEHYDDLFLQGKTVQKSKTDNVIGVTLEQILDFGEHFEWQQLNQWTLGELSRETITLWKLWNRPPWRITFSLYFYQ